jgi:hypothetical protein
MMTNEATWIGNVLSTLPASAASPCLNLGSSTAQFRRVEQPCIDQYIIAPAEARGVRFINVDLKDAPGVDFAGDIYDPAFQAKLCSFEPGSILCCNMFEHVIDRAKLAAICVGLVRPGGYIIVSVPKSCPYHIDPIDTYFRPTPQDIIALFSDCELVASEVVLDKTYWQQLSQLTFAQRLKTLLKAGIRLFLPFYKWEQWKCRVHPLLWLFRPYSVSIVALKRPYPTTRLTPPGPSLDCDRHLGVRDGYG